MDASDRLLAHSRHQQSIWCPHCGAQYDLSETSWAAPHITMWGTNYDDDGPVKVECDECKQDCWVTEWVERTYCSGKTNEIAYSNEDEAEWRCD